MDVRSGLGRNAALQDIQLDGHNWWWWKDGYSVGFGRPKPVVVDWTTPAQRSQAKLEWDRIVELGEGHDWLYASILQERGRGSPLAPCAEALYCVGVSFKAVEYWRDPTRLDAGLYHLDTRVPPVLNRAFPHSVWSRHLDSDLEQLLRPWIDPGGGYRNVVPYPH